jgi:hypothetical protein
MFPSNNIRQIFRTDVSMITPPKKPFENKIFFFAKSYFIRLLVFVHLFLWHSNYKTDILMITIICQIPEFTSSFYGHWLRAEL